MFCVRFGVFENRLVKSIQLLLKNYTVILCMGWEKEHTLGFYCMQNGCACCSVSVWHTGNGKRLRKYSGKVHRQIKTIKEYPYITLSMQGKMSILLATNDGSRADELYDILGIKRKKFDFYFWRPGVDIPDKQPELSFSESDQYPYTYSPMHISHIGRISDVKRQERSVRISGELHKRGYPLHLHLVGYPTGKAMLESAMSLAREYGIEDYVHVEGNLPQKVCRQHERNSFVTLLVGEWNRVNIFYEVMGEGAVVLTNNNHSVDEFIEDGVNCLVYDEDNYAQAAERVIALMKDCEKMRSIRAVAYRTAIEKFMSLEQRFGLEVRFVEDTALGNKLSKYPFPYNRYYEIIFPVFRYKKVTG